MKTVFMWVSVGLVCTCLAVVNLVGQRVWGQPDLPQRVFSSQPLPPAPPTPAPLPSVEIPANPFTPLNSDPVPPPVIPSKQEDKSVARPGQVPPPLPPLPFSAVPAPVSGFSPPSTIDLPPPAPLSATKEKPASPDGGVEKSKTTMESRPGKCEPSVSIEWVGPIMAKIGQPLACQIVVRNTGPMAVHQVVVRHRLPAGVSHHSSVPAAHVEDKDLSWNLGTLEPGQTSRIEVSLASQVRGNLQCEAVVSFASAAGMQVVVREPLLQVKVKGPEKVVQGEAATFQITLSNPGDATTENIKVKAVLPEGLEHSRGRSFEVEAGQLAPQESRTMQLICQATGTGPRQVTIVAGAENNLTATGDAQVDILLPKLDLFVNGPKLRYIDRHAVYAFKVTNPGSAPADNVTLSEVVPAGFKFHSASASGRYDENTKTVTWSLGDVQPGQDREVNLDLVALTAGEHKLVGHVTSARGVKTETEARTRVEGLSSLLVEMVDADDPVEVGAETAYEIRVTNIGTKMETNLHLVCTLPEQVEFRGAKSGANQRFRVEGREVIFEPLARLAPRADVIYQVRIKGMQPGTVRCRAQVRADGIAEPILREEITRIYNDETLPR